MPIECRRSTSGGKGNRGKFIERESKIVAAGLPTAQQDESVQDSLQHYLLKDEVDALISDSIIPTSKKRPLPPLRKALPLDMRNAGPYGPVAQIINPPLKTKYENLTEEFKETSYKSYWNASLGKRKDPVPLLPEGFDIVGTTFGKSTSSDESLYDLVMPKQPYPKTTPPDKEHAIQVNRKYCKSTFNPELTYGYRTFADKRGTYALCCITDDRVMIGTGNKTILNSVQTNFQDTKQPRTGLVLAPNNNIDNVPIGYTFGILKPPDNLPECLTFCKINKDVNFFRQCLKHLNTVRRGLSTRLLPTFFYEFYLALKYFDTEKTGWLLKNIVYKQCGIELIRFDPTLIEPLLSMWQAFDGCKIKYKTFVRIFNYRIPSMEMPKIVDFEPECVDLRTTYRDMVKPGQEVDDRKTAGLPSGRYFDVDYPIIPERCCAADKICLLQESDMKTCIAPSIFTQVFVDHRNMYEKQKPENVRRVFEAAGEDFSGERFDTVWKEAQKLHSQGWVCYETFRKALKKYPTNNTAKNDQ